MFRILKRKRYPKLSKINKGDTKRRIKTPEQLKKLLEPEDAVRFDDIDYSGSEISDAFEEFHKDSYLSTAKCGKQLSKLEADRLTMASFTDHFKKVMQDTRKELRLRKNLIGENLVHVQKIPTELPESLQARINDLLKENESVRSTSSGLSEAIEVPKRKDSITSDAMSGVWNMLKAHREDKTFQISEPNFNAFHQEEEHWLTKPPISWETLNNSRVKCEKWLDEQNSD